MRALVRRILERAGHDCSDADGPATALAAFRTARQPLVVCDVQMPGGSGVDLVRDLRALEPDVAILMMSGADDPEVAHAAAEHGAYGYLVKPFTPNELVIGVRGALHRQALERENRRHREKLELLVRERTSELESALDHVARSRVETIRRLMRAVELRDDETGGHIERIGTLSARLGAAVGLDDADVELLSLASPMHDVGKIGIPDAILRKPGPLTSAERTAMERHTELGHRLLSGSGGRLLDLAATIAWTHHEWFDGSGYPRGLRGDDIPVEGRIVAVADVFDALTSDRVYRPAWSTDDALDMMLGEGSRHFDPDVLACLPALVA